MQRKCNNNNIKNATFIDFDSYKLSIMKCMELIYVRARWQGKTLNEIWVSMLVKIVVSWIKFIGTCNELNWICIEIAVSTLVKMC